MVSRRKSTDVWVSITFPPSTLLKDFSLQALIKTFQAKARQTRQCTFHPVWEL